MYNIILMLLCLVLSQYVLLSDAAYFCYMHPLRTCTVQDCGGGHTSGPINFCHLHCHYW